MMQGALQKARHDNAQIESKRQELQLLLDQSQKEMADVSAQKASLQQQLTECKTAADGKTAEVNT